jgi:hypothetical protein
MSRESLEVNPKNTVYSEQKNLLGFQLGFFVIFSSISAYNGLYNPECIKENAVQYKISDKTSLKHCSASVFLTRTEQ